MTPLRSPYLIARILVLLVVTLAAASHAQIAPAGAIYVQQPSGVHYLFSAAGVQSGGSLLYINYGTQQIDIIAPVSVSSDGRFSANSTITGRSVTGQISATSISLTYNSVTISSPKLPFHGPAQAFAGAFTGSLGNSTAGIFVTSVFNLSNGVSAAVAVGDSGVYGGVGSISSSGQFAMTLTTGERLTTLFQPVRGLASGTMSSSFGQPYTYAVNKLVAARLVNIATRGLVGNGEQVLIGGFIIKDNGKLVSLNAKGPSLAAVGVGNPVQNPRMDLYLGDQLIASNANWRTNTNATAIAASGLAPGDDREAALQIVLEPGTYTFIASSEDSSQGIGLVEVYGLE